MPLHSATLLPRIMAYFDGGFSWFASCASESGTTNAVRRVMRVLCRQLADAKRGRGKKRVIRTCHCRRVSSRALINTLRLDLPRALLFSSTSPFGVSRFSLLLGDTSIDRRAERVEDASVSLCSLSLLLLSDNQRQQVPILSTKRDIRYSKEAYWGSLGKEK